MSEKRFDCQQICAVFIQVGSESMSEGMRCDPVFPSKTLLVLCHVAHHGVGMAGF